jgi:hypothetical protein
MADRIITPPYSRLFQGTPWLSGTDAGIFRDTNNDVFWAGPVLDLGGQVYDVRHPRFAPLLVGSDWTAAINAAAQTADDAGGGVVYVPEGLDYDAGSISLPSGVTLRVGSAVVTGGMFDVRAFGAVGGGVDDTAAIQVANDEAAAAGGTVVGRGTFTISDKIVFSTHADFTGAVFVPADPEVAIAVEVSTGSAADPDDVLFRKHVRLPQIENDKTGAGWAGLGTGIRLVNLVNCTVHIPRVQDFAIGVLLEANSVACAYNDIHMSQIVNNEVGLSIQPGAAAGGYVNENNFWGGRFQISSNEGSDITGARYVELLSQNANDPNNNRFWGVTFESAEPEYSVYCEGPNNYWNTCRWEGCSPVLFTGSGAIDNVIWEGYDAYRLISDNKMSETSGASRNTVRSSRRSMVAGSNTNAVVAGRNTSSSANPVWGAYKAGADVLADPETWTAALTGDGLAAKKDTDSDPFFKTVEATRRVYFGTGASAADVYLQRTSADLFLNGAPLRFTSYTDATRPAAGTAGRVIYNTDDAALNFDDGTAWRVLPRVAANGTATLLDGNTTVVVTHGLGVTPDIEDISVTPIELWGAATQFAAHTPTSTQFTIEVDQDPGQDVDFAWSASVQ